MGHLSRWIKNAHDASVIESLGFVRIAGCLSILDETGVRCYFHSRRALTSLEILLSKNLEIAGILLLVVFLFVGIIYSSALAPVPRYTDEQEYFSLADHLVHGPGFSLDGVHLTASRPPGYPFFLAGIRAVGGGFVACRVVQVLLLGATLLLVSRLCDDRKAFAGLLVVTGLVICYPVLLYTGATLYPQTLAGFLFALALALILKSPGRPIYQVAAGLTFGALILTVPTFLFTLVVVLGAARFFKIIRWIDVLAVFLFASLLVATWTVRNAICFQRFVPVATNSGLNFLEGNNGQSNAEAAANIGMAPYYQIAAECGLDEFQTDQFYREAAFAWIQRHPGDALALYFEKVANFFNVVNVYSSQSQAEVSPARQVVLATGYLLLLGLLGWRLVETKRFPLTAREKLFLSVYVLSAFTSAIFFTRIRHRLPFDYLIIAVVAYNLSQRLEARLKSSGRSARDQVDALP